MTALFAAACRGSEEREESARETMSLADINEVLTAHDDALMTIPGVTGVYVGLLDDDETPCIKIMVVEKSPELEDQLPKSLDGHPVVVVESGVIRPLDGP